MIRTFIVLALLAGCGANVVPAPVPAPVPNPPVDPIPVPVGKEAILSLFSAPWCGPCKALIPKVQKELDKLPRATREKIEFRIYVVEGSAKNTAPTDASAKAYIEHLGVDALPVVDPWRWTLFQKIVGKYMAVPAGAVMDGDSNVTKVFQPGTVYAEDIVATAAEQVE